MEKLEVLLKTGQRSAQSRQRRRDLAQFLEVVGLHLEVGSDFASSWRRAADQLVDSIDPTLFSELDPGASESFIGFLQNVAKKYPDPGHRLWFQVLVELYGSGAPMRDVVLSAADFLKKEHGREVELHCQAFPRRAQIYLLLFFLPPAFFLLFAPILLQLTRPW